jgi:penicillin amidase
MVVLKRVALALFVIIILLLPGIYFYLQSLKPDYNAELQLPGLQNKVEVLYDDFGIPHIYAQNEDDLFYAFGYVHAQDRLFQMEILRRLADGRLSEVFGEKALKSDKLFRMLSFREHARMTIDSLYRDTTLPYVRAARQYLKGLNHYIHTGKTPIEFTLAGIPITDFEEEDMQIIMSYIGYTFLATFRIEPVATAVYNKLGGSYYNDVMSQWPDSSLRIPVQSGEKDTATHLLTQLAAAVNEIETHLPYPTYHGSNGWVISGSKTKSGKPILANDTHIQYAQPSVWYEAHLECPGFSIYGNFLAGTPVPALGHTAHGAWGITMFENDDADMYREKLNPSDTGQVWFKDHWENIKVRKEAIKVKGKADEIFEVKSTRHGYLINGVIDGTDSMPDPISFWWAFYQFPSHHLKGFYDLAHARNAADAAKAVEPLVAPGLNIMWADTTGNIAWWATAKLPIRPAHTDPQRMLDGASGNDEILGWYPFSKNPQILNPARGVLYTANNQPMDMGTGLIPGYYVPSDRAERIEEYLSNDKTDWTEEDNRTMINDVKAGSHARLAKNILGSVDQKALTPASQKAFDILMKWDGSHGLDNIEPTIYYRLVYEVLNRSLTDELGHELSRELQHTYAMRRNIAGLLRNDNSVWWDDISTPAKETRGQVVTGSLNEAVSWLEKDQGADMSQWKWSNVHTITHKHPLSIVPVIGKYFSVGPIPIPGGRETLNNTAFELDSTGRYPVQNGPALRRVIDLSNPLLGFSVNPTGQSGYFMSKHYDDQAHMFAQGGKRREMMDWKMIEQSSTGKTVFKP